MGRRSVLRGSPQGHLPAARPSARSSEAQSSEGNTEARSRGLNSLHPEVPQSGSSNGDLESRSVLTATVKAGGGWARRAWLTRVLALQPPPPAPQRQPEPENRPYQVWSWEAGGGVGDTTELRGAGS